MEKNIWGWVIGAFVIGGIVGYVIAPATRQAQQAPQPTANVEQNKALARRVFEETDKGNLAAFDELFTDDYLFHFPGNPKPLNKEEHKQFVVAFRAAFPDVKHTVEDQVAEGDKVTSRGFFKATHKGEFQGIKATDKPVEVTFTLTNRFVSGKIAEEWVHFDSAGLLQQVGVIPPPAQPGG